MLARFLSVLACTTAFATAQLTLTTTFVNNNGGSVGGAVYFDLNTVGAVIVNSIDLNFNSVLGTAGSVDVFLIPGGTWVGNSTNAAIWGAPVATSNPVSAAGVGLPTAVTFPSPVVLTGNYGVALRANGLAHAYTNGLTNPQVYNGINLTLSAGGASNVPFAAGTFQPRIVNINVNYSVGAGTPAINTSQGAGCYSVADASFYESFATGAFDLGSSSVSLLRTGPGYLAVGGIASFLTPSGAAQVLALGDDSEAAVTLPSAMPVGASGSTTTLTVCSNGFISAGTGNGVGFTPTAATFLNGPRVWWSLGWHDFNPAAGGQVTFEVVGNLAVVSWNNVRNFGGTTAADESTMQAQFDLTNGSVAYVYQTMSATGGGWLVGFSDAGASADPGSIDISALLPTAGVQATFGINPLSLSATSRPVTGTNWNLAVSSSRLLDLVVVGASDPNIPDLSFLGAPGCGLRASLDLISVGSNFSLAIPNNAGLIGLQLFANGASLSPENAFGIVTSNGILGTVGDL